MSDHFGYRTPFFLAIGLHLCLILLLLTDNSSKRPVLVSENKNVPGMNQPVDTPTEAVKAITVDNTEVMAKVNQLKKEREQQKRAEINRQNELKKQVEIAKQQRLKEQQQLERLKEEANKIAIARKKEAEEEKKRLKQLAEEKAVEAKRIEELKKKTEELVKKQQLESKKLAELNEKKKAQKVEADKLSAEKERIKQEQAAKQQAAQLAERQARLSGEVNKYKALIVNAIGRNWILPENVDSNLSSQFRIRLAPNGMVLDLSLIRSSGDPLLDRSAQTAIYKAQPLPVPSDIETFNLFRDISLTVRPEQVRG